MNAERPKTLREITQLVGDQRQPTTRLTRGDRVLLHLVPLRLAADDTRQRLERVVEAVEHEVLRRIEESLRTTPRYGGFEHRHPQVRDLLDCRVLRDKPAMRRQEQMVSLVDLSRDVIEDLLHIVSG